MTVKAKKAQVESGSQTIQERSTKEPLRWNTDEDLEKETKRLFSTVHNKSIKHSDSEVSGVLMHLEKVSTEFRKYEKNRSDKSALDKAFSAATLARTKMEALEPTHDVMDILTGLVGAILGFAFFWGIIHVVLSFVWTASLFYWDTFFVAFLGATTSCMLYFGGSLTARTDTLRELTKLASSPFVAVVLVILLSELTIGVGSELSPTGVSSNIGALTLRDASVGLKLGFAFLFGFFSEVSVELLKTAMRQPTKGA